MMLITNHAIKVVTIIVPSFTRHRKVPDFWTLADFSAVFAVMQYSTHITENKMVLRRRYEMEYARGKAEPTTKQAELLMGAGNTRVDSRGRMAPRHHTTGNRQTHILTLNPLLLNG